MKNIILLSLLIAAVCLTACKKEEDPIESHSHKDVESYEYKATIVAPTSDNKKVGDMLSIRVDFESGTGETIHHINVRLLNQADSTVVYSAPNVAHVHQGGGSYSFQDEFMLSEANGITGHTNWTLEAKVWGHEAAEEEVIQTQEFHVHPE